MKSNVKKSHLGDFISYFWSHGKVAISGFSVYVFCLFSLLIYWGYLFPENEILNILITNRGKPPPFLASYLPSAVDSLVFFIFIGTGLSFVSFKHPKNAKLKDKISYIFPITKNNTNLLEQIKTEISKLACINKTAQKLITVADAHDNYQFFKLRIRSNTHIKSIHNNSEYFTDKFSYRLNLDIDLPEFDVLGQIFSFNVTDYRDGGLKTKHFINSEISLNREQPSYKQDAYFQVEAETEAILATDCWLWTKAGNGSTYVSSRFTESTEFILRNNLKIKIKVILLENIDGSIKESNMIIDPVDEIKVVFKSMKKDDSISLGITPYENGKIDKEDE